MSKLTGNSAYYTEAARMASVVKRNMRSTSTAGGTGYVWSHEVVESGTIKTGCHPTTYLSYSISGLQDLAVMDSGLFDSTFMRRVANTFAYKVLAYPNASDGRILTNDVCGNGVRENNWVFAKHPYGAIAPWDASGKVERALREAYVDFKQENNYSTAISTSMILSLGR